VPHPWRSFIATWVGNHQRRVDLSQYAQGLVRYHSSGQFHFLTFSCYKRQPLLAMRVGYSVFEQALERVRQTHGLLVAGYVLMPEHVHLLVSEPRAGSLSGAIKALKQETSKKLKAVGEPQFWQRRYYDFNVWSEGTTEEKLHYMHQTQLSADWRHDRRTGHGPAFVTTQLGSVAQSRSNPVGQHNDEAARSLPSARNAPYRGRSIVLSHPCRDEAAPWMGHPRCYKEKHGSHYPCGFGDHH
jgi:putative transposase